MSTRDRERMKELWCGALMVPTPALLVFLSWLLEYGPHSKGPLGITVVLVFVACWSIGSYTAPYLVRGINRLRGPGNGMLISMAPLELDQRVASVERRAIKGLRWALAISFALLTLVCVGHYNGLRLSWYWLWLVPTPFCVVVWRIIKLHRSARPLFR